MKHITFLFVAFVFALNGQSQVTDSQSLNRVDSLDRSLLNCLLVHDLQPYLGKKPLAFYDSLFQCGPKERGFIYNVYTFTSLMGVSFRFNETVSVQFYFSRFQLDSTLGQFLDPLSPNKPWRWESLFKEIPAEIRIMDVATAISILRSK